MAVEWQLVSHLASAAEDYPVDVTCNPTQMLMTLRSGTISIFDKANLSPLSELPPSNCTMVKSRAPNLVWVSYREGGVCLYDVRQPLGITPSLSFDCNAIVSCFDTNTSSTMLACGTELMGEDASIKFFDVRQSGQPLISFDECHSDDITCINFHPTCETAMMSGSTDGLVCLYSLETLVEDDSLYQIIKTDSVAKCGYFGPNYEYLYNQSHMETFSIYKFFEGQLIKNFGDVRNERGINYMLGAEYFDATQQLILVAGNEVGEIQLLDVQLEGLVPLSTLTNGHADIVRGYYWDAGECFYSASEDGNVCIWAQNQ